MPKTHVEETAGCGPTCTCAGGPQYETEVGTSVVFVKRIRATNKSKCCAKDPIVCVNGRNGYTKR